MKKYIVQYKAFLLFITVFFGCYALLSGLYQFYLRGFETNKLDGLTRLLCDNTQSVLHLFFNSLRMEEASFEPSCWVYLFDKSVLRIVEGCNGVSVIILFVSFILAFSGSFTKTLLFIVGGSFLIYFLNVLRVAALIALLYYYPSHTHLLHGLLFPLIIYGLVFMLWSIWVSKYSSYAK